MRSDLQIRGSVYFETHSALIRTTTEHKRGEASDSEASIQGSIYLQTDLELAITGKDLLSNSSALTLGGNLAIHFVQRP